MSRGAEREDIDVEVIVKKVGARAALLEPTGGTDAEWVPLSVLGDAVSATDEGSVVSISIPGWKARELGWS